MAHSVSIVRMHRPLSGLLAVTVRCCDCSSTDSVLTLHGLHRPEEEIRQDIEAHKANVAALHAQDQRAEELAQSLGLSVEDCGCP